MKQISICQITTVKDEEYFLETIHQGEAKGSDGFKLTLTDGDSYWHGGISKEDIKKFSSSLKLDLKDYVSQTFKALTREKVGALNFQYEVKKGVDMVTLTWKKFIPQDKIKFQLGTVELELDESGKLTDILKDSIDTINDQQEKINHLKAENERLISERANALKKVEKLGKIKQETETDLYSKFVMVLNEKKAKIRELRDQLENRIDNANDDDDNEEEEQVKPSTSGQVVKAESVRKRDTDSEYETDDEVSAPPVKKVMVKTEVTETVDDLLDEFMGTVDAEEPPIRRPKGGRVRGKKSAAAAKTPSKPALPKVTSIEKTPVQTPSRSSSRRSPRTPSNASVKSEDQPEDLMDQI